MCAVISWVVARWPLQLFNFAYLADLLLLYVLVSWIQGEIGGGKHPIFVEFSWMAVIIIVGLRLSMRGLNC